MNESGQTKSLKLGSEYKTKWTTPVSDSFNREFVFLENSVEYNLCSRNSIFPTLSRLSLFYLFLISLFSSCCCGQTKSRPSALSNKRKMSQINNKSENKFFKRRISLLITIYNRKKTCPNFPDLIWVTFLEKKNLKNFLYFLLFLLLLRVGRQSWLRECQLQKNKMASWRK